MLQKEEEVSCRENVNAAPGNWTFLSAAGTTLYCNVWQIAKTPVFTEQLALPSPPPSSFRVDEMRPIVCFEKIQSKTQPDSFNI